MHRHYRQPSSQTLCQPRENKRSRIEPIRPAPAAVPRGVHTPEAVRLCACLKHHGCVQLELAPLHGIRTGDAVRAGWFKHDSLADSLNVPYSLAGAEGFGVTSVSAQDRNCSVEYA